MNENSPRRLRRNAARAAELLSLWIAPACCNRDKWPSSPCLGRHRLQGCKCNTTKTAELLPIHHLAVCIQPTDTIEESGATAVYHQRTNSHLKASYEGQGLGDFGAMHIMHAGNKRKVAATKVCQLFRLVKRCSASKLPPSDQSERHQTPNHPSPTQPPQGPYQA